MDRPLIAVHVRELSQLFNSMDPSPFHERDLDPEAEEFITESARELPAGEPITLMVHLDQRPAEPEAEKMLQQAVRIHFSRLSQSSRRELRALLARGRISLAIGLAFLAATLGVGDLVAYQMEEQPLAQILRESLLIGGWVAMWRPMEIFLYDWWPLWNQRRLFDRLSRMVARILYPGGEPSERLLS